MASGNSRFPPITSSFGNSTFSQPFSVEIPQNFGNNTSQNTIPIMQPRQQQPNMYSRPQFYGSSPVSTHNASMPPPASTNPTQVGGGPSNIQELYVMLSEQISHLGNRVSTIETLLSGRVSVVENKLKLHDEQIAQKNEQIAHLTNTVINMQKELNSIDSEKRSNNLIIAGLSEDNLTVEDTIADNDKDKIHLILSAIDLDNDINSLNDDSYMTRIGNPTNDGKPRMLKVVCQDNETRERIIKSAPKLKQKGEVFSKIYLNRDTHPVYRKESARMRQRLYRIKQTERQKGNECDAKIIKGKLIWNNDIIDQNLFFH